MEHTDIAVIESGWWRKSNVSVRGLFDLIANIAYENPNAYHYEMANSGEGLKEAIARIATYPECKYLYLAMHGSFSGLTTLNKDKLSRTRLRNILCQIKNKNRSKLRGLHLGACFFGSDRLAEFLFEEDIGINWIAGYSKKVDWIESSAMDILFFNEFLNNIGTSEIARIEKTATKINELAPGLIEALGFGIFVRKPGGGGIRNLLS